MSRDYYSEINFHLTWHTKDSDAMLFDEIEIACHNELKKRLLEIKHVVVHEIGGIEDHVHIAVSVPPTITPSTLIGELKGGSSYEVNRRFGMRGKVLEWQRGYGIVSFGTKDLEWVRAYIRNQREHHTKGTAIDRMERIAFDDA
jgi:putative transposase